MGFIGYRGNVRICGTDKRFVQLSKTRKEKHCSYCRKKILKNSVVVSKDTYLCFCLDCYPKVFEDIRQEFKNYLKLMEETEEKIKLNGEKYKVNNIVNSL